MALSVFLLKRELNPTLTHGKLLFKNSLSEMERTPGMAWNRMEGIPKNHLLEVEIYIEREIYRSYLISPQCITFYATQYDSWEQMNKGEEKVM